MRILNDDESPATPESSSYAYMNEFAYLSH
jgi:hypothetical protein